MPSGIVRLVLGPIETNCYLVLPVRGAEATVIDPADDGTMIARELASRSLRPGLILLTHAHVDHVMGVSGLQAAFGPVPVACHPADGAMWDVMPLQAQFIGVPPFAVPQSIDDVVDGQMINVGGVDMEIIHTPGHSPGSVCIALAGRDVVFSGDTLFRDGVGRTDLWGGSWDDLARSIRERILPLPPATVLLSGHGDPTTVDEARRWAENTGMADLVGRSV